MDRQLGSLSYVVITPARNEAAFIEKTLGAMVGQTIRPAEWIIVNDGSTDETGEIAARYAAVHPWITVIDRKDRGYRQRGPGVVDAFYAGFERIRCSDYGVVVKLDGDLSFERDCFERLLKAFADDPRLGIASGQPYVLEEEAWVMEPPLIPCTYGPIKLYRRACFEDIGGIPRSLGWDGIDDWKARFMGWEIATFEDVRVLHHRAYGAATGTLRSRAEQGEGAYFMMYHPLFMVARAAKRMVDKPYIVGGLMMLWGYVKAWLTGHDHITDTELVQYLRKTQMDALGARLVPGWVSSPKS